MLTSGFRGCIQKYRRADLAFDVRVEVCAIVAGASACGLGVVEDGYFMRVPCSWDGCGGLLSMCLGRGVILHL